MHTWLCGCCTSLWRPLISLLSAVRPASLCRSKAFVWSTNLVRPGVQHRRVWETGGSGEQGPEAAFEARCNQYLKLKRMILLSVLLSYCFEFWCSLNCVGNRDVRSQCLLIDAFPDHGVSLKNKYIQSSLYLIPCLKCHTVSCSM